MLKTIRYIVVAISVVLTLAWGVIWLRGGDIRQLGLGDLGLDRIGIAVPDGISIGGPFTLVDTAGATVTDATYRGRWMLVYFGYTFCPDVCPTEMQTISAALDLLGPSASKVVPILITIDPERDTPAALAEYVKLFDSRLVGLTGTPDQIAAAARAYRVYYARAKSADATAYLMDHSSFVYLIGPDGKFRALFRQGVTAQDLAESLKTRMAAGS
ncbi:MAG: SCO family protein [Acetobacteraceae bacterium]|nr:SCO family protein [Acetobacteraceae bacterium]